MKKYLIFLPLIWGLFACQKTESGYTSTQIQLPTDLDLTDVLFVNADTGYVTSGGIFGKGAFLWTYDGGNSWDSLQVGRGINSLDYQNGEISYSVSGQIFRRSYDGENWSTYNNGGWWSWHRHVKLYDGRALLVGGFNFREGFIHQQEPNVGFSLKDTFEHELRDIEYTPNRSLYAVGYGLIMKSIDEGASWDVSNVTGDFFRGVDFPSNNIGYVVGEYGSVYKTTDVGTQWKQVRTGNSLFASPNKRFMDIAFWTDEVGFIVGTNNMVWRTTNGGKTWKKLTDLEGWGDYRTIRIFADKAYVAADKGKLLIIDLE